MGNINIVEFLKDCPKGMELDCYLFNGLEFDHIDTDNENYPIVCRAKSSSGEYNIHTFTKYGWYSASFDYSKCIIFPKGKTTWEGFQRPFVDGDILSYQCALFRNRTIYIYKHHHTMNTSFYVALGGDLEFMINEKEGCALSSYNSTARLATEEEKEKLFNTIKENGYKWNTETKTLEKLTHDKFDITTLVPFESRVLIRDNSFEKWQPAIWGYYDVDASYPYKVIGCISRCCIPYEGNEHLLGTIDDCDEYFKNWK